MATTSLPQQPQGCRGQRQVPAAAKPLDLCRRNRTDPRIEAPTAPVCLRLPVWCRQLCAGRPSVPSLPRDVAAVQPWCSSELPGLDRATQEQRRGVFPQGPASGTAHSPQHQAWIHPGLPGCPQLITGHCWPASHHHRQTTPARSGTTPHAEGNAQHEGPAQRGVAVRSGGVKFIAVPWSRAPVGHQEKERGNWGLLFLAKGFICGGTFRVKVGVS